VKITKSTLKRIISEEIQKMVLEDLGGSQYMPWPMPPKYFDDNRKSFERRAMGNQRTEREEIAHEREITKQVVKWLQARKEDGTITQRQRHYLSKLGFTGGKGAPMVRKVWWQDMDGPDGYFETVFNRGKSGTYKTADYDPKSDPGITKEWDPYAELGLE